MLYIATKVGEIARDTKRRKMLMGMFYLQFEGGKPSSHHLTTAHLGEAGISGIRVPTATLTGDLDA